MSEVVKEAKYVKHVEENLKIGQSKDYIGIMNVEIETKELKSGIIVEKKNLLLTKRTSL